MANIAISDIKIAGSALLTELTEAELQISGGGHGHGGHGGRGSGSKNGRGSKNKSGSKNKRGKKNRGGYGCGCYSH